MGKHLIIDCRNVPKEICSDDKNFLDIMEKAAIGAGATVISKIRYRFGYNSPPGFTCVVMLDESHISAHSYSDLGTMAIDIFTCGNTDPEDVLNIIMKEVYLGDTTIKKIDRFS